GQAARRGIDSCPPAHFRRPLAVSATLFLPPSGEDGGGFPALGKIKLVQPPIRATLSPALSRRMGEVAGYTSRYKFLPNYRHSRAGGNPLLNLGNCFSNISFLEFTMDSRLRGNDDSRVFGVVCS
ncbi:hypothetical protein, partial [Neisseria sp. GT4A_CT1]|uniref:hypothetical protein n=1 Tax=Neisseria sp. GT4A_CT1 TaxID=665946 RepID=UPI0018DE877F